MGSCRAFASVILVAVVVPTAAGCGRTRWTMLRDAGEVPTGDSGLRMDGGPRSDAGTSASCTSPVDLARAATTEPDGTLVVTGTTDGGASTERGSCGGSGAEVVYRWTAPASGTLVASTDDPATSFDTAVYVRTTCGDTDTELACDDDGGSGVRSIARGMVMAGETVYVFVDEFSGSGGDFVLRVHVEPADGGLPDAGSDAGSDAGFDAGSDAGRDAGVDAGPTPAIDAGFDAGRDAGRDAGVDAGFDAGRDAGVDAGRDAGVDAGGCPVDLGDCNGSALDGCETDLRTTVTACGSCTMSCPTQAHSSPTCAASTCGIACDVGYWDCNVSATDGCEADLTSPATCGSCLNVCPARANATLTCTGSACGFTCIATFSDCNMTAADGCEAALMSDPSNCGMCGRSCPGMQMCCSGTCRSSCV